MDYFLLKRAITVFSLMILVNSCSEDDPKPVDCTSSNLQVTAINIIDATCGLANGSFQLTISGGSAPFQFSVAGSNFQQIQTGTMVEGILSGNQVITVRDGLECMVAINISILNDNNLVFTTELSVAGCQTSDGTLIIAASGGKEPYTYSLDGGTPQTENSFTDLSAGDYTALVSDDDGCQNSITLKVLSGVSYNNIIVPIINAKCATSSACHDGTTGSPPNWTVLENVQNSAAKIKQRTSDGSMPPPNNEAPTPEEILAIACWVDDGALNN